MGYLKFNFRRLFRSQVFSIHFKRQTVFSVPTPTPTQAYFKKQKAEIEIEDETCEFGQRKASSPSLLLFYLYYMSG